MKPAVLIVDDSTFIVEGLTAILRKNYRPLPTFGGEEALAVLKTEKPDVIVLDIMMEPMDGWETLSRIKSNPETRHIPVLMFSAKKVSPEEAETHRMRIDDFLTKPVNPLELMGAIDRILERDRQNRAIIYHWGRIGISREKIDEYLTCSSNIDIDTSLLSAMQKQYAHPSTTLVRRQDLAASITLLEERIGTGRAALDAFIRGSGLSLPSSTDDFKDVDTPASATPIPPEAVPPDTLSDTHTSGAPDTLGPVMGTPLVPEDPVSRLGPAVAEPAVSAEQPPLTDSAQQSNPALSVPPPSVPEPEAAWTGPWMAGPETPSGSRDEKTVPLPDPPQEPAILEVRISAIAMDEAPSGQQVIPAQSPVTERSPESRVTDWRSIPTHRDLQKRKKIPAAADWAPEMEMDQVPTDSGSGTSADISRTPAGRSKRQEVHEDRKPGSPDTRQPESFFSRIIAMITGIFHKSKK